MPGIVDDFFVVGFVAVEPQHWAIVARKDLDFVLAGYDVDGHHLKYAVGHSIDDGSDCGREAAKKER